MMSSPNVRFAFGLTFLIAGALALVMAGWPTADAMKYRTQFSIEGPLLIWYGAYCIRKAFS